MSVKSRENKTAPPEKQPRPPISFLSDARLEAIVEAAYVLEARTR
jgi:hypothetical protein